MGMFGQMGSGIATQGGADWSIGLSLIGRLAAQGDYDAANNIYNTILESIAAEDVPTFQRMIAQEVPNGEKIVGSGEGRLAQSAALGRLSSFVDQNGLDAQARSANEEVLSASAQRAQGQRGAVENQMARKGMSGSGTEFAGMLSANQNAANQGRQSSLDISGQARQRALGALRDQASIGGQMRGQDIDVESKNVAAANAREEFNAKMRYAAQGANNELMDRDYKNRMAKQNALNAARSRMAQQHEEGAKRTQSDWSSVGQGMNYKHQAAADDLEDMPF